MATVAADLPSWDFNIPRVTPGDRLGMTLFCAVIAHAVVILGVVFVPYERPESLYNTLDIVLVQKKSNVEPEDAELLAQANQEGGGDSDEKHRPATPLPSPLTSNEAQVVATAPLEQSVQPTPESKPTATISQTVTPADDQKPVLVAQADSDSKVAEPRTSSPQPKAKPTPPEIVADAAQTESVNSSISATSLITRSLAMASLSAEIDQRLAAYSERPRRKWISAKTREYRYAAYMEAWRIKVERIGNLNYPDEARRKKLSGHLLLEVVLNANGSINDIILRRSSGQRVLDDAAIRIVKLAAPFAPLPDDILAETDILHIERTWRFMNSNQFLGG